MVDYHLSTGYHAGDNNVRTSVMKKDLLLLSVKRFRLEYSHNSSNKDSTINWY